MKKIILLMGILCMFPVLGDVTLDFGIYATNKPITLDQQFKPLINSIENIVAKKVGEDVDIYTHAEYTYEDSINNLIKEKVDFARLDATAYVIAKQLNPAIRIIAAESIKGKKDTYGVIIVHRLSSIEKVEELKGSSFAFAKSKSSILRCLAPRYLYSHGITAKSLLRYEYLGRHDRVATSVGLGQFDAGALKESTFIALRDKGVPIKEIAKFENMTSVWVAREKLPEEIYKVLQESILEINTKISPVLEVLGIDGFIRVDDGDYNKIRDAVKDNDKFFNSQQ